MTHFFKVVRHFFVYLMAFSPFVMTSASALPESSSSQSGSNLTASSHILIFISFSLPDKSLKAWLEQAHHLNAPVLIRGWFENSPTQTQTKLASLSPEGQYGLTLEPRLFKTYQITQVPAVVVRTGSDATESYERVVGDSGLEGALSYIAHHTSNNAVQAIAESALHTIRQPL